MHLLTPLLFKYCLTNTFLNFCYIGLYTIYRTKAPLSTVKQPRYQATSHSTGQISYGTALLEAQTYVLTIITLEWTIISNFF